MTGVEGYVESVASGFYAGINKAMKLLDKKPIILSSETAIGALSKYISSYSGKNFQPMNVNFGIIDSLPCKVRDKQKKYGIVAERALSNIKLLKTKGVF